MHFKLLMDLARQFLDLPVFPDGEHTITVWHVMYLTVVLSLLVGVTGRVKKWLTKRFVATGRLDIGISEAISTIVSYVVIGLGFFIILDTAGVDVHIAIAVAGALGIGMSLGLQTVTNSFVSGLTILIERPIKVGDHIEIGNISGRVVSISWRATSVLTNDNITIIVPNSDFVTSKIINHTYNDRDVRVKVPVGVSYDTEPQHVKKLLLDIGRSQSGVLEDPPPNVVFRGFGDSAMNFDLLVWTREYTSHPQDLVSELNFAIYECFKKENIEMPFPQRDIHIRTNAPAVLPGQAA